MELGYAETFPQLYWLRAAKCGIRGEALYIPAGFPLIADWHQEESHVRWPWVFI